METTTCPSCDREVSTAAAACPGCGQRLKGPDGRRLSSPVLLIGALVVLAGVGVVIASLAASR